MNVSKWPLDRIMQLPDWCFGRKYCVSCAVRVTPEATVWDISEVGYPDMMVLWFLQLHAYGFTSIDSRVRIALGDKEPKTIVEMDQYDDLIHGLGQYGTRPRRIFSLNRASSLEIPLKMPIATRGRKLVIEAYAPADNNANINVQTVVSSIPKEVPDWVGKRHEY